MLYNVINHTQNEHFDKYPFVIVRRGGYSVRFNELSPAVREDMIAAAKNFRINNP